MRHLLLIFFLWRVAYGLFNQVVYYADAISMTRFDEELNAASLGLCGGSGVLKVEESEWKIAHYNLALTVPYEPVYEVKDQILALDVGKQMPS